MSYSGKTVAQLKELLKQRELPIDGLKADLIARLEASDKSSAQETNTTDAEKDTSGNHIKDESIRDTQPANFEAQTTVVEQPRDEAKPADTKTISSTSSEQLSPDQLKQLAIDHLQRKLRRAEKFGDDETTTIDLQRQISRIHKFGLDLSTQLAKDLGVGKGPAAAVGKSKFRTKKKNFKKFSTRRNFDGPKRRY